MRRNGTGLAGGQRHKRDAPTATSRLVVSVLQNLPFDPEGLSVSGSCFTGDSFTSTARRWPALSSPQAFILSGELPASSARWPHTCGTGAALGLVFAQLRLQHCKRVYRVLPQDARNLTHFRERTNRKHGTRATVKQRRANRHATQWAFAELHGYVAYKALLSGSIAVTVDAYKTSQACPRCGYTSGANRPDKGLVFSCQRAECQLVLHADLVGARNVALRTLLIRQDWVGTGVLSEHPNVSDEEAKAAQRRRYAELRWSPDTSPYA
jgi:hypothetical protein